MEGLVMDSALRSSIRKLMVVALVVTALGVGYLARGAGDGSSASPKRAVATKKLTASDLLLAASTAQGIHLRYAGITTGPLNADHTNDIQMTSFQFGVNRAIVNPVGGTRTIPNPKISDITLTHQTDKFSLALLNLSLRGNTGAVAALYFTDLTGPSATPIDYLEADLSGTLVSGFSTSSGGDNPSESVSLDFTVLTFKYRAGGAMQSVTYNITKGS
jgi:type VI secretion system secreted protein Hcp